MALTDVKSEQIQSSVALAGSPTTTTQSASDNSTKIATTAYVETAVANLVASAPAALNTLDELAAALNDDASFSTTVTNSIATKLPLAGGTMTGDLILGDNVKLEVGSASGGDLQLYHDGSNSYIAEAGTGDLIITATVLRPRTDDFVVNNAANSQNMITATAGGAATLYHGGSPKIATTSTGISVTGTGTFAGGAANNNDDANILTLNASQHARLLVDTSSTSGHRATLALESNGNELTLSNTGSASYLTSVGNLEISGGNVGIGASSPSQKLHVVGKIKSTDDLIIGGANPRIDYDGGSSGALRFFSVSANAERMRINSSGTVGIGTTDLHSWATFDGRLRVGARAFFGTTTGSSQMGYNWYYDGAYKYIAADYANRYIQNDGHHWWQTATSGSADGAITWVSMMRLNNDGRLTLGPDHMDIQIDPASTNSGNNLLYMRGNASGDKAELQLNHYGHADYHIGVGHVANGTFNISNTQTGSDFVINSSGNVGIGTSNPGYKLTVSGESSLGDFSANGFANLGRNADGNQDVTTLGGYGVLSSGTRYGRYGVLRFRSSANYTSSSRGYMITNGYGANKFAILQSNSATTMPNIASAGGGASDGDPVFIIDHAGRTTQPKQPYVQGRGNAGWSATAGSSTWNLQPHGNTPVTSRDHGNNYSTTNKRFTCPVDGVYLVQASWYIYQTAAASYGSQYVHPAVFKNGSSNWNGGHQPYTISGQMMERSGSGSKHYDGLQISFTIYCSANDYLEIYLYSPNSNPQSYENYHYFSYMLLS